MIELNASSPSHPEQPRRKNIYPQFSLPTTTLRSSYRRWPKPGIQHLRGKQQNSSPPQCCHIKGVSEPLHRHLQQQGIRTVFKSDTTIRSRLVRPKDPADPNKENSVVCTIPYTCGKVYIGETGRPMQERMKGHDRDIRLARTQNGTKQSLAKLINVNDFLKSIINFGVWYLFRAINSRATFFMIAVEPLKGF